MRKIAVAQPVQSFFSKYCSILRVIGKILSESTSVKIYYLMCYDPSVKNGLFQCFWQTGIWEVNSILLACPSKGLAGWATRSLFAGHGCDCIVSNCIYELYAIMYSKGPRFLALIYVIMGLYIQYIKIPIWTSPNKNLISGVNTIKGDWIIKETHIICLRGRVICQKWENSIMGRILVDTGKTQVGVRHE